MTSRAEPMVPPNEVRISQQPQSTNKNLLRKLSINYKKGDILVIHGDKLPNKKILKNVITIIIGHEHPAISIKDWPRVEIYKCFLVGKWNDKDLIVLPSFNEFNEGHDIIKEENISPFLNKGFSDFRVYVVGGKVYDFGYVRDL